MSAFHAEQKHPKIEIVPQVPASLPRVMNSVGRCLAAGSELEEPSLSLAGVGRNWGVTRLAGPAGAMRSSGQVLHFPLLCSAGWTLAEGQSSSEQD